MRTIRRADQRGRTSVSWLDSRHSFSFGGYYDPAHMGFGPLRVINDDRIRAGGGFPTHGHQNMEILTYVVEGVLAHEDSLGHGSTIVPDEIQAMTAGRGITHSEFNPSEAEGLRLLQIWIEPDESELEPQYQQVPLKFGNQEDPVVLAAGPKGSGAAITIHSPVKVFAVRTTGESVVSHDFDGSDAWLQMVTGTVNLGSETLEEGDGVAIRDESRVELRTSSDAEFLIFQIPRRAI